MGGDRLDRGKIGCTAATLRSWVHQAQRKAGQHAGASAEVIVGGMRLGTLLTLFVLPALYAALPERRRSTASAGQGPGSGGGDAGAIPGPQPAE